MSKISVVLFFIIVASGIGVNGSAYKEENVGIYELKQGDFSVKLTNAGAAIMSLVVPDKNGKLDDVVLGYESIKEYMNETRYFGAIVGRVASRIGGANFTLNGTLYTLDKNDKENILHGGKKGFSEVVWEVKNHTKNGPYPRITFTYHAADGEQGFPGDLDVAVTYALIAPYQLSVNMQAKSLNKATPVNLAQHTYWNIGGHNSGNVLADEVQIFASHITPVDSSLIPTGEIVSVEGTPYDFRKPHAIGSTITKLNSKGYDINYVLYDGKGSGMKPAAIVHDKKSGRVMKVSTDAPAMQFYTANYIRNLTGKGGCVYQAHAGLCLETQGFPDSVDHPHFPSQIVNPGETYKHNMLYTFSTKDDIKA